MSFEPFSVQCLTCGSKLRVPDPTLVGTIAACPRCSSMVQIEPADATGQQVAVGASDVDSEAITQDSIPAPHDANLDGEAPSGFNGSDSIDESIADESIPAESAPMPPSWQSERTHRSRQVALVVAVSISGLLAAALMFSWFVRNWNSSTANVDTSETELEEPAALPSVPVSPDEPPDKTGEEPVVAEIETESDPPVAQADDPGEESDPVEGATGTVETDVEIPADLLSPLIGGPLAIVPAAEADDEPAMMTKLPAGLEEFGIFLEGDGPVDLRPNVKAPPTLDEVDINRAAEENIDPMLLATPIAKVNVKSDLAIQIALDSKGYPLADLVLLLSQVTGVPIQIDWVSFDLLGIDVHQPIQVPQPRLASVKDLLDEVAASLGAEIQVEATLVTLTPTDESFQAKAGEIVRLDDFGDEKESAVIVLNRFLHGPDSEPSPVVRVGTTREDKQFAIIATESLRRMRGLPGKTKDPLLGHWAKTSDDHSTEWPVLIGGKAHQQRSMPISVAGLIRHTSRINQASTMVYWSDATRRKLSPSRLLLPHQDVDAAATFKRLLDDYGLQARRVDANRWWVGTPATYDRAKVIVWTKPLADEADALETRIGDVMAQRDTFRVSHDPISDRAIMLLPRYIVRQLPKIRASLASNKQASK